MQRLTLLNALLLATMVEPLPAQTPDAVKRAAETIVATEVAHHVRVIADDSMMGRGTPSPGLTKTAQYVAEHFKQFGLKPGGDSGTWFQRYPTERSDSNTVAVANTVGILEGSDPVLKSEYIVLSAHMDHLGTGWGKGFEEFRGGDPQPPNDSIYNGADDNGSGTAGIIELAQAFSQPGARPRRSLIFITVAGEETGPAGSRYFVNHPPVPRAQIVADINFDMIGRWTTDTVTVIGLEHSDLGTTFERVNMSHPEVRLVPLENPISTMSSSDQIYFATRGIPVIKFGGPHDENPDYHRVTDSPNKITTEWEARILRFAFYLGQAIANADRRPQWNPESYKEFVREP